MQILILFIDHIIDTIGPCKGPFIHHERYNVEEYNTKSNIPMEKSGKVKCFKVSLIDTRHVE